MLAKRDIIAMIQSGDLSISPYSEDSLGPNAYHLHVGTTIKYLKENMAYQAVIDTNGDAFDKQLETLTIPQTGFVLNSKQVYVLELAEQITSEKLSGQLVPITSLAAQGLMVTICGNVSHTISGPLTVLLTAIQPIIIYPGQALVSMYFAENSNTGVPLGGIIMWSGYADRDIPYGYAICDGSNGTPDLRNRFIIGIGQGMQLHATGGSASVTLTEDEMPKHTHDISGMTIGTNGDGTPFFRTDDPELIEKAAAETKYYPVAHTNTDHTGGGNAHENLPPYYALAFIMRIA